jgi:hypothetical protein
MSLDYAHPHISVSIEQEPLIVVTGQGGTMLFSAFTANKGLDNTLQFFTSPEEFIKEYGDDFSISKNRQQPYNIMQWLKNGTVGAIRVCPTGSAVKDKNAAYGGVTLSLGIKKVFDTVDTAKMKGIQIKPFYRYIEDMPSVGAIEAATKIGVDDVDGFKVYDLITVYAKGRGNYGNNFAFAVTPQYAYEKTYSFPTYTCQILQYTNDNVLELRNPYTVAFEESARTLSRESMFIKDLLEVYESEVKVFASSEVYTQMEIFIGDNFDFGKFNFLDPFKTTWNAPASPFETAGMTISHVAANAVNGEIAVGGIVRFKGGRDGDLSEDSVNNMLIDAYSGALDKRVTSTKTFPLDVILDGNEPLPVKNAMAALARDVRQDCMAFVDTGFTANSTQAAAFKTNNLSMSSENVAIFSQDALVSDLFDSSRKVRVTAPFFLASKIPFNDKKYSIGRNFVGLARGVVSGVNSNDFSWFPASEAEKETLYLARVNYIDNEDVLYFDSQNTSRLDSGALSNISVARSLFRMARSAKSVAKYTKWEYFLESTYSTLRDNISSALNPYQLDKTLENINVVVTASRYDKREKLLRVKIIVKFTDIIERVAITFSVQQN